MFHTYGNTRVSVVITKCLLIAVLPFLGAGFTLEVVKLGRSVSDLSPEITWFFSGCLLFIPIWWLGKRYFFYPWQFICTFEHEITHALVGLPFLMIPRSLRVTATMGGHVEQTWRGPGILRPLYAPGHLLSTLAPYFLPTTSYLLIGVSFLFTTKKVKWFLLVLGFLTAFHVISTWAETHYHQPDIQNVGPVFSSIFLPVANVMALGGVVAFAENGPTGFVSFWVNGALRSLSLGRQLLDLALRTLHS